MHNYENLRLEFMSKIEKDNIKHAYKTLFKKISKLESKLNKNLEEFNDEDIKELIKLVAGKTLNSTKVKVSTIKKYMKYAGNEYIDNVKTEDIRKIMEENENEDDKKGVRYIDRNELIKCCENTLINASDKAILMLLYNGLMGNQFYEIANLKVNDITFISDKEVKIKLGDRIIRICDEYLCKVLEETIREDQYINDGSKSDGYKLNPYSAFLIKTRAVGKDKGLNPYKPAGIIGRVFRITSMIGKFEAMELHQSWVINELIKYGKKTGDVNLSYIDIEYYLKRKLRISGYTHEIYHMYNRVIGLNK